ncbi:chemotaxis protein CheW, partial [Burkholderia sp. Tr-860]|nr:chemotaxis protein CheW [Burkholderia sp. Tr-860]
AAAREAADAGDGQGAADSLDARAGERR